MIYWSEQRNQSYTYIPSPMPDSGSSEDKPQNFTSAPMVCSKRHVQRVWFGEGLTDCLDAVLARRWARRHLETAKMDRRYLDQEAA